MSLIRSAADILAEITENEDLTLTDIEVVKVFSVNCPACKRPVAAAPTYTDALIKRRDHFYATHRGAR